MKFISKTHVAINIVLASGANVHVTFIEKTGKGSVYYTDNPDIANALRSHYKFGKLFKEEQEPAPAVKPAAKATGVVAGIPAGNTVGTGATEEGTKTENVKEFANNEDAKDYLAERYGISRSKMRTRAAIEEAAKSVNITVKWTE